MSQVTTHRVPPKWAMPDAQPQWQKDVLARRNSLLPAATHLKKTRKLADLIDVDREELKKVIASCREHDKAILGGRVSIQTMIYVTCAYFGYPIAEIVESKKRRRDVCSVRFAIYVLAREFVAMSIAETGRHMNVDHTSALHGYSRGLEKIRRNPQFAAAIDELREIFRRSANAL